MTIPNLLITLLISMLIGFIFHVIRGGNGWRMLIYIMLSVAGFLFAQWLGTLTAWALWKFGGLDIGLGVVGSVLFLLLGEWLIRK